MIDEHDDDDDGRVLSPLCTRKSIPVSAENNLFNSERTAGMLQGRETSSWLACCHTSPLFPPSHSKKPHSDSSCQPGGSTGIPSFITIQELN